MSLWATLFVAAQTFETSNLDWLLAAKEVASASLHPKEQKALVEVDGFANDLRTKQLYLVDLDGKAQPTLLTPAGEVEGTPAFSPDGLRYAFLSTKGGVSHLVVRTLGSPVPAFAAKFARSVDDFTWAADGQALFITYKQDPTCTERCHEQPAVAETKPHITDELLFRRWDSWVEKERAVIARLDLTTGELARLSSTDVDTPPFALHDPRDFDASSDGKWLAWVEAPTGPSAAWSTDTHVVVRALGSNEALRISSSKGYDRTPRFTPDHQGLVWRQMQRAGFESDRNELMYYDLAKKTSRALTTGFDYSVQHFVFSADGKAVFAEVADQGGHAIFRIPLQGGKPERWQWGPGVGLLAASGKGLLVAPKTWLNGGTIAWVTAKQKSPVPVYDFNADLTVKRPPTFEAVTVKTKNGPVQAWVGRPSGTEKGAKLPAVLLLHGGPQGAWTGTFTTRWNAALFAAQGYLVVLPNPRGSVGFGQAYTDAISHHWPDAADDVLAVLDQLIATGDVDGSRTCAAGASYGGYLTDWIATRTNRFKCLISHDGPFNLESEYGSTEEVFFGDWEHGSPWEQPERYAQQSPHRFVDKIQTPMLLFHGEKDYRVPYTESLQLFTALRRRGVPARLVVFPTENHWVLAAANKRVWFGEMFTWLDRYLASPSPSPTAPPK